MCMCKLWHNGSYATSTPRMVGLHWLSTVYCLKHSGTSVDTPLRLIMHELLYTIPSLLARVIFLVYMHDAAIRYLASCLLLDFICTMYNVSRYDVNKKHDGRSAIRTHMYIHHKVQIHCNMIICLACLCLAAIVMALFPTQWSIIIQDGRTAADWALIMEQHHIHQMLMSHMSWLEIYKQDIQ